MPPAFAEARAHVLSEGANKGKALDSLDDATLATVISWYRARDFMEWRAAMLTGNWRAIERAGLAEMTRRELERVTAGGTPEQRQIARWYLEHFGKELQ